MHPATGVKPTATGCSGREFHFEKRHFEAIRRKAYEMTGISLSDAKEDLVYGRLSRRLRKLGMSRFDDYLAYLDANREREGGEFVNALTTNLTAFFRETHHFEHLRSEVFPDLLRRNPGGGRLRIWSAGCSTGEEPYSLAMTLHEAFGDRLARWDALILATDIDTGVIATGREGVYAGERLQGVPASRLDTHFEPAGATGAARRVRQHLRDLVRFRPLNLLGPWPMKGLFDIVFCRNVIIYFDKPTQQRLFDRFADQMAPDGRLFIGHSESLFKVTERFEHMGKTIHRVVPNRRPS